MLGKSVTCQLDGERIYDRLRSRRAPYLTGLRLCAALRVPASPTCSREALRRHLDVAHQLTPDAYRQQFGLGADYPMTVPGYFRQRSEMAKRFGLGQRKPAPARARKTRRGG